MDQSFLEGGWLGGLDKASLREPLKPKDNNGLVASSNCFLSNYEHSSDEKQNHSGSKKNSTCIQMIDKSVLREIYDTYSFRGGGFGYRRPGMTVEGFRAVVVDAKLFGKDDIKARREAELVTSAILSKSATNLDFDQFVRALSKLGKRIPWSKIKGEIAEATHLSSEEKVFVTICQTLKGSEYERNRNASPVQTSQSPMRERMAFGRACFSSPKSERERRNSIFKYAAKKNPLCLLIEKNQKAFQVIFTHYMHRETGSSAYESRCSSTPGISTNELRKFAQDFGVFPDFMQLEDLRETMLDVTSNSEILSTPGSAATGNYSIITTCEQFTVCLVMIAYYAFGEQPIKAFEEVIEVDPNEATERLLSLFRRMNFMREKRPAPPMPVNFVRFKDLENCTPSGSTPVRKRQVSVSNSPQSSAERVRRGFNASRILFGTDSESITNDPGVATNSINRKLEKQLSGSCEETPVSEKDYTPVNDWHSSYSSTDRMSRISTVKERLSALSKSSISPETFTNSESKENHAPSSAGTATENSPLAEITLSIGKNTPSAPLIGRPQPFAKTAFHSSQAWNDDESSETLRSSDNKIAKATGRLQIGKTPPFSILPYQNDLKNYQTSEQSELQDLTNEIREANRCLEKATAELELSPFLTDDYKFSPGEALFDDIDFFSEMFPSARKQGVEEFVNTVTPSLYLRSLSKTERFAKKRDNSEDLGTSDQANSIKQLLSDFGKEQTEELSLEGGSGRTKRRSQLKVTSIWSQSFVLLLQMVIMMLFFLAYAYTFGIIGYDPVVDEPFLS